MSTYPFGQWDSAGMAGSAGHGAYATSFDYFASPDQMEGNMGFFDSEMIITHIDETSYVFDADFDPELLNDMQLWRDVAASVSSGAGASDADVAETLAAMSPASSGPNLTKSTVTSPMSEVSTTASPVSCSGSEATSSGAHSYICRANNCFKTFRKESQLKQHRRVHRKQLECEICFHEQGVLHKFAQTRDLERHYHTTHPDEATERNIRSETRQCPFPGCDYSSRRDNVSRHHESKHGRKLKWRRGVPSLVD